MRLPLDSADRAALGALCTTVALVVVGLLGGAVVLGAAWRLLCAVSGHC